MFKKLNLAFGLCLVLGVCFLGFNVLGCASATTATTTTTTAVTTTSTTTSTTSTTTSTAATTTTTTTSTTTTTAYAGPYNISGTATDYYGSFSSFFVLLFKDSLDNEPLNFSSMPQWDQQSQVTFSTQVTQEGNYYLIMSDYGFPHNETGGNYVGTYGWTGTEEITAVLNNTVDEQVLTSAISFEVSAPTTEVTITMHPIITSETFSVTFSATIPAWSQASKIYGFFSDGTVQQAQNLFMPEVYDDAGISGAITPGNTVTLTKEGRSAGVYRLIVTSWNVGDGIQGQANTPPTTNEVIGAYGWQGTAEVTTGLTSDQGELWLNMATFEVTNSDVYLGLIDLHDAN